MDIRSKRACMNSANVIDGVHAMDKIDIQRCLWFSVGEAQDSSGRRRHLVALRQQRRCDPCGHWRWEIHDPASSWWPGGWRPPAFPVSQCLASLCTPAACMHTAPPATQWVSQLRSVPAKCVQTYKNVEGRGLTMSKFSLNQRFLAMLNASAVFLLLHFSE